MASKNKHFSLSQNKKRALQIGILLILAILIGGGAYGHYKIYRPLVTITEEMNLAENALINDRTIAVASFNFVQFNFLENLLIGTPDGAKVEKFKSKNESWDQKLQRMGIDPRLDLKFLLGSIDILEKGLIGNAILVGRFRPQVVQKSFGRKYTLKEEKFEDTTIWSYQEINKGTCRPENPRAFWFSENFIVWSNPVEIKNIINRLKNKAPASQNKKQWEKYRQAKIFSSMINIPKEKVVTNGMMETISQQALQKNLVEFEKAFLGINIDWLKRSGNLNARLEFQDKSKIKDKIDQWRIGLEDTKASWRSGIPSLSKLLNKIVFSETQTSYDMDVGIDQGGSDLLKNIPKEFISYLFSGFGMSVGQNSNLMSDKDVIDQNPPKYENQVEMNSLPVFNPKGTFFGKMLPHISGPIGFTIKSIGFDKKELDTQVMDIEYVGVGIPNIQNGELVSLYFNEAKDRKGVNQLKLKGNCEVVGIVPASHPLFFSINNGINSFKGNTTLSFLPQFDLSDLEVIRGEARISVPSVVEDIDLEAIVGQKIETDDFDLIIKKTDSRSITVNIYGDDSRVLGIEGLNAENKVLQTGGSGSMGFFYGEGKSKNIDFRGKVSKVRVHVARKIKTFSQVFEIRPKEFIVDVDDNKSQIEIMPDKKMFEEISKDEFENRLSKKVGDKKNWNPLSPTLDEYIKEKDTWLSKQNSENKAEYKSFISGPFVFLWDSGKESKMYEAFKIYSNDLPNAKWNNSLDLSIASIETEDGRILTPPKEVDKNMFNNLWAKKDEMMPGTYQLDPNTNLFLKYLSPPLTYSYSWLPENLKNKDLKKIKGNLRFRLINKMQSREMLNPKLGARILEDNAEILKLIEVSDSSYTFQYNNKWGTVLGFQAFDANNVELERTKVMTSSFRPDTFNFYWKKGTTKIIFYFLEKEEFLDYPFELDY